MEDEAFCRDRSLRMFFSRGLSSLALATHSLALTGHRRRRRRNSRASSCTHYMLGAPITQYTRTRHDVSETKWCRFHFYCATSFFLIFNFLVFVPRKYHWCLYQRTKARQRRRRCRSVDCYPRVDELPRGQSINYYDGNAFGAHLSILMLYYNIKRINVFSRNARQ